MRVPLHLVYRAFPELDDFTDEQCQRLVTRARRQTERDIALAGFVWGAGGYVVLALVGAGVVVILQALGASWSQTALGRVFTRFDRGEVDGTTFVVFIVMIFLCICPLILARDASLRMALRILVRKTTCPSCAKTLLGARRTLVTVICRECRSEHDMARLGIEAADLGPALFHLVKGAKCPKCGYPVTELPIKRGIITCPECGHTVTVADDPGPPPTRG